MKYIWSILYMIAAFLSHAAYATQEVHKKDIAEKIKVLVNENQLKGSSFIAVVDSEGLNYFSTHSGSGLKVDVDTNFLVASHTKAMASTLLAVLAADNKIDLMTPIKDYFPNYLTNPKVKAEQLNLKKLLTHTGGFTSIPHTFKTAFLGFKDNDELLSTLNENLLVAPNYDFRYSNTGPIVAADITEKLLGSSWKDLITQKVFKPLNMNNTSAYISDYEYVLPALTISKNNTIFTSGTHKVDSTMHAAGGIVSNINDLAKWLVANINQDYSKISKLNIFKQLHEPQVEQSKTYFTYKRSGYTLGWDVASYNDEKILTRFGNYGGYSIHVSFMPDRKLGVISFTNQDIAYVLPHVIANYAYNTYLQKENRNDLFDVESKRLSKSIKNELTSAPDISEIVRSDDSTSMLIGTYLSNKGWPQMTISASAGHIEVSWGELKGPLIKRGQKYQAILGPLKRPISFNVENNHVDSLTNGSIVYIKK